MTTTLSTLKIGLVGSSDNGKSTLFQALVEVMDQRGALVPPATIRVGNRHILLIEKPEIGYGQKYDGLILVTDATQGIDEEVDSVMRLAAHEGITQLVVFMNKADMVDDEDALSMAEMEMQAHIAALADKPQQQIPVVSGSALAALEGDPHWIERMGKLVAVLNFGAYKAA